MMIREDGKAFRRPTLLAYTFCLLLLGVASTASAEQIVVEYSFEHPVVKSIVLGGQAFDRVTMPETPSGGMPGQPALPSRGARILIPSGSEVTDIQIEHGPRVLVGTGYTIEPVVLPHKLSEGPTRFNLPEPDESIYNSDLPYPQTRHEEIMTGVFRGYRILTLKLHPVEYLPASGELYYYPDLVVTVTTEDNGLVEPLYRGSHADELAVMERVDNDKEISQYRSLPQSLDANYDMLIICHADLVPYFQSLKEYHDTTGVATEIHTTATIGSTDPDDIRDYIRDRYLIDGIQFVLIGADDDVIPAKDLYVISWDGPGADTETEMPGDLYFGCLDGTWNYDGDSQWGEPGDGEGGGEVDLIAEVYVGRAPVGHYTEAERFVSKTLQYAAATGAYLQDVLMCGEYLGFGGVSDYAGNMMDQMVDGSSADGYTTVGIPSDEYSIDYLYDRDWWNNDWPQTEIVTRINSGLHIINHLGHGNETYAMKLLSSEVSLLTNSDHCFIYSQACYSGHFDGMDCFAEELHIKSDYAAFAVIMNARYGWGTENTTDGPSQRFNREFWDAVYSTGENKPTFGAANHDSKEDNLYRINESCMRWCYYEITLFGDPAMYVRGVGGISFSYPGGIPQTVTPGQTTTFEVQVETFGDGDPVAASGQLHYAINGGTTTDVPMTEIGPDLYEATLPSILCGDYIDFHVSAEEASLGRVYDPDPASPHHATAATAAITAFEDDFETDKSWTVSGGQWARGNPTGGGGEYGSPDPSSAYAGSNVFGYNLSGDYANNIPEYHLTSPAIDCSNLTNVHVSFQRWLGVEQPAYDHAYVRVSNNGTTWTTVWENPYEVADTEWNAIDLDLSAVADNQATVYVRFTMGTTDGGWTYCGWNIDDLAVTGSECDASPGPNITTETLPDGMVGASYSETLTATGGVGTLVWTDKNDDLTATGLSLSTAGVLSGTPVSSGLISFTALVTDDSLQTDEKLLSLTIQPELDITTTALPEGTTGEAYSETLIATGGIGLHTWSDRDSDLVGTGLSLAGNGVLSGTPTSAGPIAFTAVVTDEGSNTDEQLLSFDVYDPLVIGTSTLPDWTEGQAFNEILSASGGVGSYTWTDKNSDLVGTGLSLSSNGTLTGTPSSAGTIAFTAMVADEGSHSDEVPLSFAVNPPVSIDAGGNLDWTVGILYDFTFTCTGGTGSMTWSDKHGDLEGAGLSLSTEGHLSGTPADTGLIGLTVMVTDGVGATDEIEVDFTINPAVSILTASLPIATQDEAYSHQLEAAGGTGELSFGDVSSDLEGTGISLSGTGLLSGTPTDTGTVTFTLSVGDTRGSYATEVFDLHVSAPWMCGDLNDDGNVTLSDITILIDHVYISKSPLDIPQAGNVNGSTDGLVTLSDITVLIDHVYISKGPLNCL